MVFVVSQIVAAAIAAGLYPSVVAVQHPEELYSEHPPLGLHLRPALTYLFVLAVAAKMAHGAVPVANDAKDLKFFILAPGASVPFVPLAALAEQPLMPVSICFADGVAKSRVFIHPRSVNFSNKEYESPYLVYLQLVQTAKVYIQDCTSEHVSCGLLLPGLTCVHAVC
jgi:hypothetical protein